MFQAVVATEEHAEYVAANIRQQDVEEMRAMFSDVDTRTMLLNAINVSHDAYTWVINDEVVAVCGVREVEGNGAKRVASPWLIGTPALNRNPKILLRASRMFISMWLSRYDTLYNYFPTKCDVTKRYLARVGFTITEFGKSSVTGEDICLFYKEA